MKKYKLFLDDVLLPEKVIEIDPILEPNSSWVIVKSYKEFTEMILQNGIPYKISLDHDLEMNHYKLESGIDYSKMEGKSGYHCALWLINYCKEKKLPFPSYIVHSMNKEGKKNIIELIENFKKQNQ
jgi:hypothetical protein